MFSKIAIVFLSLTFSFAALAGGLNYAPNGPTLQQVELAKDALTKPVFSIPGVNGIGVTACDSQSGVPFYVLPQNVVPTRLFVNCLDISTSTHEAVPVVKGLFPQSRYHGIFVNVEYVGQIIAQ